MGLYYVWVLSVLSLFPGMTGINSLGSRFHADENKYLSRNEDSILIELNKKCKEKTRNNID